LTLNSGPFTALCLVQAEHILITRLTMARTRLSFRRSKPAPKPKMKPDTSPWTGGIRQRRWDRQSILKRAHSELNNALKHIFAFQEKGKLTKDEEDLLDIYNEQWEAANDQIVAIDDTHPIEPCVVHCSDSEYLDSDEEE